MEFDLFSVALVHFFGRALIRMIDQVVKGGLHSRRCDRPQYMVLPTIHLVSSTKNKSLLRRSSKTHVTSNIHRPLSIVRSVTSHTHGFPVLNRHLMQTHVLLSLLHQCLSFGD